MGSNIATKKHANKNGFTIVELIVVVIVIAILAGVTLAVYNGITARARGASMQSDASSGSKKLFVYQLDHQGQYPASIADVGLTGSSGNTYQYTVDNAASPSSYCLTVTSSGIEYGYYVSSASSTPVQGLCPGHVLSPAPPPTNSLTPPANTSNITINPGLLNRTINTAYTGYINIWISSVSGSPTPTAQWQRLSSKNTDTGTWQDIPGQTANQLTNWLMASGCGCAEGDYVYVRVKFTNSSGTAVSDAIKVTLVYEGD